MVVVAKNKARRALVCRFIRQVVALPFGTSTYGKRHKRVLDHSIAVKRLDESAHAGPAAFSRSLGSMCRINAQSRH